MRDGSANPDKLKWLAKEIFSAFPQDVTGLKFYTLDPVVASIAKECLETVL